MQKHDNATWFFEKPSRGFHNAEAWWTSFFTIFAFYMARSGKGILLPVFKVNESNDLVPESSIDLSGMTYENTVVDARLRKEVFGLPDWPNQFNDIKPDITVLRSGASASVIFIEVKTIGTSVKRNALLYPALREHMRSLGWESELYYLMSKGHEEITDWPVLRDTDSKILRWEDIFAKTAGTPFENMLGESLPTYTK
ncbi:MAG: hypothetical protein IPH35_21490 [Rhodoferax sp.]|nr:hypothetical protein [Rhodoferax sp.]